MVGTSRLLVLSLYPRLCTQVRPLSRVYTCTCTHAPAIHVSQREGSFWKDGNNCVSEMRVGPTATDIRGRSHMPSSDSVLFIYLKI